MIELCKLIWCGLIGLFRSRASLEIEILALRHQLNILRRKSPKRPILGSIDRLVFVGLYGLAPDVLSALAIIRPETVIRWHRDRFPLVLAMEVPTAWWPSKGACGRWAVGPKHQHRQPALGRSQDPRRTPQAWHRCRPDDGCQVHGSGQATSEPRMEDVSSKSCRRHCVDESARGPNDLIPTAVRILDSAPWSSRNPVDCNDRTSECRMDRSSTHRTIWLGVNQTASGKPGAVQITSSVSAALSCRHPMVM